MARPKFDPSILRDEITDPKLLPGAYGAPISARAPEIDPEKFIREIKGMLVGGDYDYAEVTLRGILQWVEENGLVTAAQVTAIDRIAAAPRTNRSPAGDIRRRWERE